MWNSRNVEASGSRNHSHLREPSVPGWTVLPEPASSDDDGGDADTIASMDNEHDEIITNSSTSRRQSTSSTLSAPTKASTSDRTQKQKPSYKPRAVDDDDDVGIDTVTMGQSRRQQDPLFLPGPDSPVMRRAEVGGTRPTQTQTQPVAKASSSTSRPSGNTGASSSASNRRASTNMPPPPLVLDDDDDDVVVVGSRMIPQSQPARLSAAREGVLASLASRKSFSSGNFPRVVTSLITNKSTSTAATTAAGASSSKAPAPAPAPASASGSKSGSGSGSTSTLMSPPKDIPRRPSLSSLVRNGGDKSKSNSTSSSNTPSTTTSAFPSKSKTKSYKAFPNIHSSTQPQPSASTSSSSATPSSSKSKEKEKEKEKQKTSSSSNSNPNSSHIRRPLSSTTNPPAPVENLRDDSSSPESVHSFSQSIRRGRQSTGGSVGSSQAGSSQAGRNEILIGANRAIGSNGGSKDKDASQNRNYVVDYKKLSSGEMVQSSRTELPDLSKTSKKDRRQTFHTLPSTQPNPSSSRPHISSLSSTQAPSSKSKPKKWSGRTTDLGAFDLTSDDEEDCRGARPAVIPRANRFVLEDEEDCRGARRVVMMGANHANPARRHSDVVTSMSKSKSKGGGVEEDPIVIDLDSDDGSAQTTKAATSSSAAKNVAGKEKEKGKEKSFVFPSTQPTASSSSSKLNSTAASASVSASSPISPPPSTQLPPLTQLQSRRLKMRPRQVSWTEKKAFSIPVDADVIEISDDEGEPRQLQDSGRKQNLDHVRGQGLPAGQHQKEEASRAVSEPKDVEIETAGPSNALCSSPIQMTEMMDGEVGDHDDYDEEIEVDRSDEQPLPVESMERNLDEAQIVNDVEDMYIDAPNVDEPVVPQSPVLSETLLRGLEGATLNEQIVPAVENEEMDMNMSVSPLPELPSTEQPMNVEKDDAGGSNPEVNDVSLTLTKEMDTTASNEGSSVEDKVKKLFDAIKDKTEYIHKLQTQMEGTLSTLRAEQQRNQSPNEPAMWGGMEAEDVDGGTTVSASSEYLIKLQTQMEGTLSTLRAEQERNQSLNEPVSDAMWGGMEAENVGGETTASAKLQTQMKRTLSTLRAEQERNQSPNELVSDAMWGGMEAEDVDGDTTVSASSEYLIKLQTQMEGTLSTLRAEQERNQSLNEPVSDAMWGGMEAEDVGGDTTVSAKLQTQMKRTLSTLRAEQERYQSLNEPVSDAMWGGMTAEELRIPDAQSDPVDVQASSSTNGSHGGNGDISMAELYSPLPVLTSPRNDNSAGTVHNAALHAPAVVNESIADPEDGMTAEVPIGVPDAPSPIRNVDISTRDNVSAEEDAADRTIREIHRSPEVAMREEVDEAEEDFQDFDPNSTFDAEEVDEIINVSSIITPLTPHVPLPDVSTQHEQATSNLTDAHPPDSQSSSYPEFIRSALFRAPSDDDEEGSLVYPPSSASSRESSATRPSSSKALISPKSSRSSTKEVESSHAGTSEDGTLVTRMTPMSESTPKKEMFSPKISSHAQPVIPLSRAISKKRPPLPEEQLTPDLTSTNSDLAEALEFASQFKSRNSGIEIPSASVQMSQVISSPEVRSTSTHTNLTNTQLTHEVIDLTLDSEEEGDNPLIPHMTGPSALDQMQNVIHDNVPNTPQPSIDELDILADGQDSEHESSGSRKRTRTSGANSDDDQHGVRRARKRVHANPPSQSNHTQEDIDDLDLENVFMKTTDDSINGTPSKRTSTDIVPSIPSSPASTLSILLPEPGEVPYNHSSPSEPSTPVDEVNTNGVDNVQLGPIEVRKIYAGPDLDHGREFAPVYERACDLQYDLEDLVNNLQLPYRNSPYLRELLKHAIYHNTRDEEEAPQIDIVNNVDNEVIPPWEFHYSNKMWHGENVPPPNTEELYGCDCVGVCNPKSKTCACVRKYLDIYKTRDYNFDGIIYDNEGHLIHYGWPIYECNDLCRCSDMCKNRVVQYGRKCKITIQKTQKKGWGIFAGEAIPHGTYIGIYSGELLTDQEGERRGELYNKVGRTYLFDLDFWFIQEKHEGEIQNRYTVDAFHAGNFTRFLNHSCDPNCVINACYINEANMDKPLLTIFTQKDVQEGEELCFSYFGQESDDEESSGNNGIDKSRKTKTKNKKRATLLSSPAKASKSTDAALPTDGSNDLYRACECGAPKCRKTLFMRPKDIEDDEDYTDGDDENDEDYRDDDDLDM